MPSFTKKYFPLFFFLLIGIQTAYGQASVSRSVSQVEICPDNRLKYLGNIILSETLTDDFAIGDDQTLILQLPAGLTFYNHEGVATIDGANISNLIYFTSGDKLFLKYDISGTAAFPRDKITLNGFRIQSSTSAVSGDLLRSSGTATINGGSVSDGLVYASIKVGSAFADAGSDAEICLGDTQQIGTAAVAGHTYSWIPASSLDDPTAAMPVASPTARTTYTLTVTDEIGCQSTDKVTIEIKDLPDATITASGSLELCQGDNVTLTAPASSGTYRWSNGATTQSITVGSAGSYNVKVTDNGCYTISSPVEVTVTTPPVLTVSVSDPVACYDQASVSVSASLTGSVSTGSWSGGSGTFANSSSLSTDYTISAADRAAGEVTLRFTSADPAGGCEAVEESLTIQINPEVVANAGADQVICRGESLVLGGENPASGGNGNFQYQWSGPDGYASSNAAPMIQPVASGTYTLLVTDGLGCSHTDNVTVTVDEPAVASVQNADEVLCFDTESVNLTAIVSGGATSGTWAGGSGSFSANAALNTIYSFSDTDKLAGSVTLTFTTDDPAGQCAAVEDSVVFTFYDKLEAMSGADVSICLGDAVTLGAQPAATGGTGSYVYSWTSPGFTSTVSNPQVIPASAGTFEYVLQVTDGTGCVSANDTLVVTVNDQVTVEVGNDIEVCEYERDINLEAILGGPVSSGVWSGGAGAFADAGNPVTVYTVSDADVLSGRVVLTFTADDADGTGPCSVVSDSLTLTIRPRPEVAFAGLQDQYAENEPQVSLTGFPSGGSFSGNGIVAGTSEFDPSAAELGLNEIVYTYQDAYGCVNADTQIVVINSVPQIAFGLEGRSPEVCYDEGPQRLVYEETQGGVGTFSGVGVDPDVNGDFYFDPTVTGQGVHQVYFRFETFDPPTVSEDTLIIQVFENPVASFDFDQYVCIGEEVTFSNTSTIAENLFNHDILSYEWEYGNGESSTDIDGMMTYLTPGQYIVTLTVFTEECENSLSQLITVGGIPEPEFRWEDISEGNVTRFFDQTPNTVDPPTFVTDWEWNFGDTSSPNNTSELENPTHTFTTAGEFEVSLTVTMNTGCQEMVSRMVQILPSIVNYPYFQDFETTAGWVPIEGGAWELGTPGGTVINTPYSGSRSWVTNLDGEYPNNAQDFINGPDFDLSVLQRPMLSFYYQSDLQSGFDGVVMQYSLDGGRSWDVLGKPGDGNNWYNESSLVGNPGNQVIGQYGWSGQSGWKRGAISLNDLNARTSVRLRLAFGSDASNPPLTALEGFAFDDIYVGERQRQVLAEHFIDGYGEQRLAANDMIDLLENEIPYDIIQLQYRTNIEQGSDTLFTDAMDDISARTSYYGITEPLRSVVDGNYLEVTPAELRGEEVLRRSLQNPVFTISLDTIDMGPYQVGITASIEALEAYNQEVVVQIAIAEEQTPIDVSGYKTNLHYVVKKLLPDAGGNTFTRTWVAGDTESLTETWQVTNVDNPNNLVAVVFVQSKDSREVLQTVTMPLSPKRQDIVEGVINPEIAPYLTGAVLYPNPADRSLMLDFNTGVENDLQWSLIDPASRQLLSGEVRRAATYLEVDTKAVPDGMYFMVLSRDGQPVYYEKVIIRHQ